MNSMHRNQGHLVNWGWFLALAHEQNISKGSLTIINRWQGLCNQTRLYIFPVNVLETGQKFYNPVFHSPEFSIPHRANDFLEDIKRFSDFKKTQRRFNPLPRMGLSNSNGLKDLACKWHFYTRSLAWNSFSMHSTLHILRRPKWPLKKGSTIKHYSWVTNRRHDSKI